MPSYRLRGQALLFDLGRSFLRRDHSPHFIKGIHIERQRIQLTVIVGDRAVGEPVEFSKPGNIIPDFFIVGMENMGTVFMHVDAFHVFCINIAGNIGPLVNDKDRLACRFCLLGKNSAEQTGAYNQIILHKSFPFPSVHKTGDRFLTAPASCRNDCLLYKYFVMNTAYQLLYLRFEVLSTF